MGRGRAGPPRAATSLVQNKMSGVGRNSSTNLKNLRKCSISSV